MSRVVRVLLLVSLGLNVGLGWTALRALRDGPPRAPLTEHAWRGRPAADDTAAWRRMMHHRVERLSSLLDLSPEQAARLQQRQATNGPLVRARQERIEAARRQVRTAAGVDSFDPAAVRAALIGLRRAQADLDSLTQEFLLQEFTVMDGSQRERYLELLPLDPWRGSGPGGHRTGPGRTDKRRHPKE